MLLGSESKDEFDRLVSGLMDHYRPVGTLEEALVDQLATSLWRFRRLLMAEKAEIAKAQPAERISQKEMLRNSVVRNLMPSSGRFETAFLTNSRLDLTQTLGALKGIRDDIRKHGLSWERDHDRLEEVLGKTKEPLEETEDPDKKTEQGTIHHEVSGSSREIPRQPATRGSKRRSHCRGIGQADGISGCHQSRMVR